MWWIFDSCSDFDTCKAWDLLVFIDVIFGRYEYAWHVMRGAKWKDEVLLEERDRTRAPSDTAPVVHGQKIGHFTVGSPHPRSKKECTRGWWTESWKLFTEMTPHPRCRTNRTRGRRLCKCGWTAEAWAQPRFMNYRTRGHTCYLKNMTLAPQHARYIYDLYFIPSFSSCKEREQGSELLNSHYSLDFELWKIEPPEFRSDFGSVLL